MGGGSSDVQPDGSGTVLHPESTFGTFFLWGKRTHPARTPPPTNPRSVESTRINPHLISRISTSTTITTRPVGFAPGPVTVGTSNNSGNQRVVYMRPPAPGLIGGRGKCGKPETLIPKYEFASSYDAPK